MRDHRFVSEGERLIMEKRTAEELRMAHAGMGDPFPSVLAGMPQRELVRYLLGSHRCNVPDDGMRQVVRRLIESIFPVAFMPEYEGPMALVTRQAASFVTRFLGGNSVSIFLQRAALASESSASASRRDTRSDSAAAWSKPTSILRSIVGLKAVLDRVNAEHRVLSSYARDLRDQSDRRLQPSNGAGLFDDPDDGSSSLGN